MTFKFFLALLVFCICLALPSNAQNDELSDSTEYVHSPKRAATLSALLPGAGQAYNKKYWKMPIVYAGLGTSIYFIVRNNRFYQDFRQEYIYRINNGGAFNDPDLTAYRDQDLLTVQDTYRRWRDLSYIATGLVYVLQIVDASVDAHFFDWDTKINEDLSLKFSLSPSFASRGLQAGISLRFH